MQIAGADPAMMADAARYNVDQGAQIIDINMGCPAKKVCNVMAGSALLQGRAAGRRASSTRWCSAVDVPVTLKIRTGWDKQNRNALRDRAHRRGGRHPAARRSTAARAPAATRGDAEYDTIARGEGARSRIPVIANGDIDSPEKAQRRARRTPAPTA